MLLRHLARAPKLIRNNRRAFHITVLGGGQMGAGIAQVSAQAGHTVTIMDVNEQAVKKSISEIEKSLARVAKKQLEGKPESDQANYVKSIVAKINITSDISVAVKKSDLVIEAIVENLDAKQKLFSQADALADPSTIFATNTSSLSVSKIASCTKRQDKFGGLHFFNPVAVMKLVEVVRGKDTTESTVRWLVEFAKSVGKVPITCTDTPGFVVNRLLIPYMHDAMKIYEQGVATKEDIDTAMKLGAGYPMGPFALADLVGLDTMKSVFDSVSEVVPDLKHQSPTMEKLVKEGKLGVKTGEGFFKYEGKSKK